MDDLLRTARLAADAAARVQRAWTGRIGVADARDKGMSDFVTRTDLEAQEAALEVIRTRHPDHEILAEEDEPPNASLPEESGSTHPEGSGDHPAPPDAWPEGPLWVVDPLDGTTNFIHRHPMYTASVGLVLDGRPAVGAIVCPATGERWSAARGRGAWKGGRRIRVSDQDRIRGALIGTGFPFKALDRLETYQAQFARVLRGTAGIRRGGSAALDLCYLAQGSLDAFWELVLSPWDVAAGLAILSEAGGSARRLEGGPIGPAPGTVLAANSERLMETLGRLVRGEGDEGHGATNG